MITLHYSINGVKFARNYKVDSAAFKRVRTLQEHGIAVRVVRPKAQHIRTRKKYRRKPKK